MGIVTVDVDFPVQVIGGAVQTARKLLYFGIRARLLQNVNSVS
jgi:hypothetical protein